MIPTEQIRGTAWLKENGYINKEHSKVKGEWQLLQERIWTIRTEGI